jgi:hypothetical protein
MWTLTKLFITGVMTLFWLQNAAPNPGTTPNVASASSPSKAPAATTAAVAASQPVMTVHGVCEESEGSKEKTASNASSCVTIITREQFEKLVQALHPGQDLPANARNNLAKIYAEYLTIEAATRKGGMEDTSEFHEFMNWTRVLAASEYYRRKLQEKYSNPSQEEIDAYYQQHLTDYETAKLARVMIPRENALALNKDEFEKKALAAANTAQVGLATGLDPTEVQKTAYAALGLQGPPAVDIGIRRRKDFIAEETAEVFSLKAGEVTKVQTEPRSYVIYKVLSREAVSEESLKKQISGQLTEKKFRESMKSLLDTAQVDLNEQYFGAPGPPDNTPPVSPHSIVSH